MPSSDVYIFSGVAASKALHQHTINDRSQFASVKSYLAQFAQNLAAAYQAKVPIAITEINNYHPGCLGKKESFIRQNGLDESDFQLTIAREHGYDSWEQVEKEGQNPIDLNFEQAIDLLLAGKKAELENLLTTKPDLIHTSSSFGHKARLIHYIGSNGVEFWRQVVPLNLPAMTKLLLEKGADTQAIVKVYGGSKVVDLVSSSAHPWAAGVAEEVLALL